jgi:hypothetical protein
MFRSFFGRRDGDRERRRWPRSRAGGCLLWVLLLIVILIVLSLMFGGFRKGTKAGGPGDVRASGSAVAALSLPALSLPAGNKMCHSAGHEHL